MVLCLNWCTVAAKHSEHIYIKTFRGLKQNLATLWPKTEKRACTYFFHFHHVENLKCSKLASKKLVSFSLESRIALRRKWQIESEKFSCLETTCICQRKVYGSNISGQWPHQFQMPLSDSCTAYTSIKLLHK